MSSAEENDPAMTAKNPIVCDGSHWDFWKPLFITTGIFCALGFVTGLRSNVPDAEYSYFFGAALFFAFAQLTGAMAALGPGNYWRRLIIAQTCWFVVLVSMLLGTTLAMSHLPSERMRLVWSSITLIASLASQLAFGVMRVSAGWRLGKVGMSRASSFTLKDIFVLTLFIAITLAVCQQTLNHGGEIDNGDNTRQLLVGCCMAFSLVSFVIGVPMLGILFYTKVVADGCFLQVIVLPVALLLGLFCFTVEGATNMFAPMLMATVSFFFLSAIPLAAMRENGLLLTTWHQ